MSLVLIIERDASLRGSLTQFLASKGYAVLEAADGSGGVRLARQARPAAVLVDLSLSTPFGFEVLDSLRWSKETRYIPVVGLTTIDSDTTEFRASGVDWTARRRVDVTAVLAHLERVSLMAPPDGETMSAAIPRTEGALLEVGR